jgi:hypothetical protein
MQKKNHSLVSCLALASTQKAKTKTIAVGVTAAANSADSDEMKKKEPVNPSHTDGRQQVQVVNHLNPATTDICLHVVPFANSYSYNYTDTDIDSDLMLHKIVCDCLEDVWSAGGDEDRLELYEAISAIGAISRATGAKSTEKSSPIGDCLYGSKPKQSVTSRTTPLTRAMITKMRMRISIVSCCTPKLMTACIRFWRGPLTSRRWNILWHQRWHHQRRQL